MTSWTPELAKFSGPRYAAIANALAAVADGNGPLPVVGLDVGCDGAAAPRTSICTQGSSAVAASRARPRLSEVGGTWRSQWANVPSGWKFHSVGASTP